MRALDSNVLLRHLMQDDPGQSPAATRFLSEELTEQEPGFVSIAVLCETVWTLKGHYGEAGRERVDGAVRGLINSSRIVVAEEQVVASALTAGADLIDALIHALGRAAGCSETVTFDRRFARAPGVRLLTA
ncbi:MAG TPA: type II toxin-antitoxin system VapC family toxin [Allosphingosinicella sp.]|nr:type II toxin-antitoxin system VapC family toxin [Allosphingosinicella sp.]